MSTARFDDFAACAKRRYGSFPLNNGTNVRIQSVTEGERADIERRYGKDKTKYSARSLWIAKCVVDDDGDRVFGDSDEHYRVIDDMDASLTGPLSDKILEHCGILAGDQETSQKNSETIPDVALP